MAKEYIERGALPENQYYSMRTIINTIIEYIGEQTVSKYPSYAECKAARMGAKGVIYALENAPAADVVEVVRCKDCIFGHKDDNYHLGYACEKPLYHPAIGERPHRKLMQDCDFCSYGERKE